MTPASSGRRAAAPVTTTVSSRPACRACSMAHSDEWTAPHDGQQLVRVTLEPSARATGEHDCRDRHSRSRRPRRPLRNFRDTDRDAAAQGEHAHTDTGHARDRVTPLHLVLLRAHDRDAAELDGKALGHLHLDAAEQRDDVDRRLVADDLRVTQIDLRASEKDDRVHVVVEPPRPPHLLARQHTDRPPSRRIRRRRRFDERRQRRGDRDELGARLRDRAPARRGRRSRRARATPRQCDVEAPRSPGRARRRTRGRRRSSDISTTPSVRPHQYDRGSPSTCSAT